jgi:cyclohexyl-isocyanide hydratase
VQLALEYDPAPPFDSGSPDKAAPATLKAFHEMTADSQKRRERRVKAASQHAC